jgi:hypothetical protein
MRNEIAHAAKRCFAACNACKQALHGCILHRRKPFDVSKHQMAGYARMLLHQQKRFRRYKMIIYVQFGFSERSGTA